MANSLVKVLLQNLIERIIKEAELLGGENDELKLLSEPLNRMSYFFNDSDGIGQDHGSLKELVSQVTDLAYEAEDIIDDYVHCHYEERGRNISRSWLPLCSKSTEKWRWLFVPSKLSKKCKILAKKIDILIDKNKNMRIDRENAEEISVAEESSMECGKEGVDVVGFTNETEELIPRLTGGDLKRVTISIVGMEGLGKTALARKIYQHFLIKNCFKVRVWIHVSRENTPAQLLLRILRCLIAGEMNAEDSGMAIKKHLVGKKYLIVLDDVWDGQVWDDLIPFFPDDNNRSRILLTSRYNKVALRASPNPKNPPHYLRFRDKEESWALFQSRAFPGDACSPKWEELGRRIVEKCRGLPLAIVFLGSILLKDRERVAHESEIYHKWSGTPSHVSTLLYERSEKCKEICALRYNELPYYIKPCFLYLVAFPENYQIPARQLVQLWIAEGFVSKNDVESMEDTGEKYLETLADLGLIQVVQKRWDGRVKTCSIHFLYRDFCISESQREGFLHVDRSRNSPQGPADSPAQLNHRRLVGIAKTVEDIYAHADKFRRLHSILCFTLQSGTSEAWTRLFKTTKFLKVLKVLYASILPDEVKNLMHLRYLGLDKSSLLEIPSSMCNLLNLEVLDARSKFIRSVPPCIWNLQKLRHAYFEGPTYLPPPPLPPPQPQPTPQPADTEPVYNLPSPIRPPSIPKPPPPPPSVPSLPLRSPRARPPLSPAPQLPPQLRPSPQYSSSQDNDSYPSALNNLQSLSTISADSCTAEVFQNLPNLLKLGVKVEGYLIDLSKSLGILKKLRTLKLAGAADFSPLLSFPLIFPPNLTKLTMCDTQLQKDPMLEFGGVPKLQVLKLSNNAYSGTEMVSSDNGFPRLRVLKLVNLEHIQEIKTRKGALPKLEQLVIHDCHNLQRFTGLEHLTSLQVVDLRKPSNELRHQMQQFQFQLNIDLPREDLLAPFL